MVQNPAVPTVVSRPYAGAADLPAVLALWPACRHAAWQTDFPAPSDLTELLQAPAATTGGAQVWVDEQGAVWAYALVDGDANLWFDRTPQAAEGEMDDELVAWGLTRASSLAAGSGEAAVLDTSCRAEDARRIALLIRCGFQAQPVRTLRFVRSLAEPIPAPSMPAGYTIRSIMGESEVPALVTLHRAAFGTGRMTDAERLAWMRTPDYDPGLDLVAVAPDGSLAAYCFCAIHAEDNLLRGRCDGFTDPLATHPEHQGRGLARALLCEGMARLRNRGVERALLGTRSDNLAMQAAARAAGYTVESERLWFRWQAPTAVAP